MQGKQIKNNDYEAQAVGTKIEIRLCICTWHSDRPPWQAIMQGTQIENNDYVAQAVWGKFGIRLCICTWHSDRPPWQARMQGQPIENNDYGAQAAGEKVWNQAAPMYLAIRSTPSAS